MDPLSLAWHAPSDCPSGPSVTRAVERLITKAPARTLEASSTLHRDGERWSAEIKTPRGERRLEGESCRAVSEAVAMVLALAIDPEATPNDAAFASFDEPERAESPAPPAAPVRALPAAAANAPTKPAEDRTAVSARPQRENQGVSPRFLAGAFGLVELGMLPQATFGATLGLGAAFERWSAELGPMVLVPRSGSLDSDESRGGEMGYIGGYAAGCFTPFRSRRLDLCGAFEAGRLAGTGFGVTHELTGEALWLAPELFGAGRLPLAGPLQAEARIGAAIALHRPEFVLDDLGPVHRSALVSFRGELGFSFR
jgi:hypothetical protein